MSSKERSGVTGMAQPLVSVCIFVCTADWLSEELHIKKLDVTVLWFPGRWSKNSQEPFRNNTFLSVAS